MQPHRWKPTRLPRPRDSPGKNTGVGCHFLLQCMKGNSESEVAQSCLTLATPWTAAHQAPPSMGFPRQSRQLPTKHLCCPRSWKALLQACKPGAPAASWMHRLASASPRVPSHRQCLTTSPGWEVVLVTGFWKVHLVSLRESTDLSWCLCLALAKSSCLFFSNFFLASYFFWASPLKTKWNENVNKMGDETTVSHGMFSAHLDNHTALSPVKWISNCSVHQIYSMDWQNSDFWLSMPIVWGGDKRLHFQAFPLGGDVASIGTTHWELNPGASSRYSKNRKFQVISQYHSRLSPTHPPLRMFSFSHPCHCQPQTCWSPESNITRTKRSQGSLNIKTLNFLISLLLLSFKTHNYLIFIIL